MLSDPIRLPPTPPCIASHLSNSVHDLIESNARGGRPAPPALHTNPQHAAVLLLLPRLYPPHTPFMVPLRSFRSVWFTWAPSPTFHLALRGFPAGAYYSVLASLLTFVRPSLTTRFVVARP